MTITVDLLPLDRVPPDEIVDALAAAVAGLPPGIVVVDAALLGPRIPADRRVVEVVRRADLVWSDRLTADGITRLVRVGGLDLVDAGAVPGDDGEVAFPPEDPSAAAHALWEACRQTHGVVLVSTATPSGHPVALGVAGTASPAAADHLGPHRAVHVRGLERSSRPAPPLRDPGRSDAVRAALGVRPGTADALEVGIPHTDGEDVEARVDRACRVALRPLESVPQWHPVRRRGQTTVDPSVASATVLQIGVRLDAPDDFTLGVAVGRLVVALAAEGLTATPIRHEATPAGVSGLVAFLDDATS